ncbi:unnamed protein product [Cochlearia groenlandica]
MIVLRLITLIILLLFASTNTTLAEFNPYEYDSLSTRKGVWDQKVLSKIRGVAKPSKSRPAGQRRKSQRTCSEDSSSSQCEL